MTDRESRAEDVSEYKRCQPGDIVLNRMRAFQGAIGISRTQGLVTPEYLVLRPIPSVEPRFLHYLFKSSWFVGQMTSRLHGIGTAEQGNVRTPRIYWGELGSIALRLPDLREQRVIADLLDHDTARIDALVAAKRLLLDRLVERRESVVFRGVTGLLDSGVDCHDPGLPWVRAVRKPWPSAKIKHVGRLGTGHTPSRSQPEYWEHCTIPWITTGEIKQVRDDRREVISGTREMISELGLANSSAELHEKGTVVLCRTASAGYSAIMGASMATSQDFVTWACSDRLLPRYLLMCLRAMRSDLLGRLAFGSTHKTIYMPDIEALQIPLPSVSEQREVLVDIDLRLADIDALTERVQSQLSSLIEHRQGLITAAVTQAGASTK